MTQPGTHHVTVQGPICAMYEETLVATCCPVCSRTHGLALVGELGEEPVVCCDRCEVAWPLPPLFKGADLLRQAVAGQVPDTLAGRRKTWRPEGSPRMSRRQPGA